VLIGDQPTGVARRDSPSPNKKLEKHVARQLAKRDPATSEAAALEAIAKALDAVVFHLQGHVHALYVQDEDGKRKQQKVGEKAFHDRLRGLFRKHDTIPKYRKALLTNLSDPGTADGGEPLIWDGNLDFLPKPLQPRPYPSYIESSYESGGLAKQHAHLQALADWVKDLARELTDRLTEIFDDIDS